MVIKSAKHRELVVTHLGVNALTVKMESAGIFREYPSVVIKSVCDYADSHKNKARQPFAAATIDCAAKALLERITPEDAEELDLSRNRPMYPTRAPSPGSSWPSTLSTGRSWLTWSTSYSTRSRTGNSVAWSRGVCPAL